MKNSDDFIEHLQAEKKLSDSKQNKGYKEYADELVSNKSLVQLIGCDIFYLKSELESLSGGKTKSYRTGISPNGSSYMSPAELPVNIDTWVIERYQKWKNETSKEEQDKIRAFWATDCRMGIVVDKSTKDKENFLQERSKGVIVKVVWLGISPHWPGWESTSNLTSENISYHHVKNLRSISVDGPVEKRLYPCDFSNGKATTIYY
tara:strand:- start:594 stop:1208 length:615 start_codon:yes stop_codon:yes gene_type:complete